MKPKPAPRPNVTRRMSWLFGIGATVAAVAIAAGLTGGTSAAEAKSRRGGGLEPTATQTAPAGHGGGQSRSLQEW